MNAILKTSKGKLIFGTLIFSLFVISVVLFVFMQNRRNVKQTTKQVVNYGSAVQIIQPGQKSPVTTSRVMLQEKETALSLLERTQTVAVKKTSLGSLVEAINGIKNGSDGKYWTYLVNGKEANVGAGQYIVRSDDIIVWQYTKQ